MEAFTVCHMMDIWQNNRHNQLESEREISVSGLFHLSVLNGSHGTCIQYVRFFATFRYHLFSFVPLLQSLIRYACVFDGTTSRVECRCFVLVARVLKPMDAQQSNEKSERQVEKNSGNGGSPSGERADATSKNKLSALIEWHVKLAQDVEAFLPRPVETTASFSASLRRVLPDFAMRAERGSVTARNYLTAYELLLTTARDAFDGRDSGVVFRNFRAAKKLWEFVPRSPVPQKVRRISVGGIKEESTRCRRRVCWGVRSDAEIS